ncbi:hypothetical protein KC19_11G089200 [Ceratodon purpureus]|uniref:Uncharacterized protein n=1 Tax=Ceratodon purpureus TaxID=3225 RepID=A0A8T0GCH8_CERPU|nr:hypothetical protein KC19_11G089200 [Ceratodon purpureus]
MNPPNLAITKHRITSPSEREKILLLNRIPHLSKHLNPGPPRTLLTITKHAIHIEQHALHHTTLRLLPLQTRNLLTRGTSHHQTRTPLHLHAPSALTPPSPHPHPLHLHHRHRHHPRNALAPSHHAPGQLHGAAQARHGEFRSWQMSSLTLNCSGRWRLCYGMGLLARLGV